jgi:prophage maintenance system killer protein
LRLPPVLARPRHLHIYQKKADIAALAAAYGWDSSAINPSTTATSGLDFSPSGYFLSLNGLRLEVDPIESVQIIMGLAENQIGRLDSTTFVAGEISEYHDGQP